MSLGILARYDGGGLGTLTREVFRHLEPARTLLISMPGRTGREGLFPWAYDIDGTGRSVYPTEFAGAFPQRARDWIAAEGITTLWSAETFYDERVMRAAHQHGIRTVVYAMPELAPWSVDPSAAKPRALHVPTEWRADTVPGASVLEFPVATDRLPWRGRDQVRHIFHITGSAMLDRNGTNGLLAALPMIPEKLRVTIRSEKPLDVPACHHDIEVVYDATPDYWRIYPDDIDLLVMPRRYGGLSLPVQECAALGVPSVVLGSDPYAEHPFTWVALTDRFTEHRMKGGMVPVWQFDPADLATAIRRAVTAPGGNADRSSYAQEWAAHRAWDGPLGDRWREMLSA